MACSSARASICSAYGYVRRVWHSLQVELHGQYSFERMQHLQAYSRATSLLQVILVILTTDVPCILAALLLDCIPLQPPSTGLGHSQNFRLRGFVMASITFINSGLLRHRWWLLYGITRKRHQDIATGGNETTHWQPTYLARVPIESVVQAPILEEATHWQPVPAAASASPSQ
ncbi:hypothetical protein Gpo141_00011821 [Globisporangium polare]